MKVYICKSCGGRIIVGHPASLFRRQALTLAREARGWIGRLLRLGRSQDSYRTALEERYYLEPHHYRAVPRACPRCGNRGDTELPWWRAGVAYPDPD